jgi:hypothetical protein
MLEFQEIKGCDCPDVRNWLDFAYRLNSGQMKPMDYFMTYSNKYWNPFIFVKGKEYSFIWRVKKVKP